jgi:hypothetical protein
VPERAEHGVASVNRALYSVGARVLPDDKRDAVVELATRWLFSYERRDLVVGGERLADELAADAASRTEDGELHGATRVSSKCSSRS